MVSFSAALVLLPVLASSAVIDVAEQQRSKTSAIDIVTAARARNKKTFLQKKRTSKGADVYYVAKALDKMKFATTVQQAQSEKRYALEGKRLAGAITRAETTDRATLQMTVEATEESKMEEMNAYKALYNMYYTIKASLGAAPTAPTCDFLTCGEHGQCLNDGTASWCACKPCFEGDGFICRPSSCSPTKSFTAQPMLHLKTKPSLADVHLAVFQQNRLVAAFRDEKRANHGYLMLGEAGQEEIRWGQMQSFSKGTAAFQPQVIGYPTGRIIVQYRDGLKNGVGYIVGGRVDEADASKAIMLTPYAFVKGQAEAAALVPLASSRAVCLYSHPKVGKEEAYGGALFLQVAKGGAISVIGKYRFADHIVNQVAAVALRPNSFVVAFRDPPREDESSSAYSRELSVVWMSMQDNELIVDPHPIVIDAKKKDMGIRDVSLVSENLFAYSYQSNSDKETKIAIVRVDPDTHRMKIVGGPQKVGSGDTKFVKGISLPFQSMAPHTFTYVQQPRKNSVAETCRVSPTGKLTECQELPWSNTAVSSASAARLGDGRLVFVFGDDKKDPYYQMLAPPGA